MIGTDQSLFPSPKFTWGKGGKAMVYTDQYHSPLGLITLVCDEEAVTGVWFAEQRHFENALPKDAQEKMHPLLEETKRWLDIYFTGQEPDFCPALRYDSTPFRKMVCDIMRTIPYGKTITYGEIAAAMADKTGIKKMSAQAVGGAVGHNPISILIPCHRVIGANGNLTGYGGGISRKVQLLRLEQVDMTHFFIPKKGTAL